MKSRVKLNLSGMQVSPALSKFLGPGRSSFRLSINRGSALISGFSTERCFTSALCFLLLSGQTAGAQGECHVFGFFEPLQLFAKCGFQAQQEGMQFSAFERTPLPAWMGIKLLLGHLDFRRFFHASGSGVRIR